MPGNGLGRDISGHFGTWLPPSTLESHCGGSLRQSARFFDTHTSSSNTRYSTAQANASGSLGQANTPWKLEEAVSLASRWPISRRRRFLTDSLIQIEHRNS